MHSAQECIVLQRVISLLKVMVVESAGIILHPSTEPTPSSFSRLALERL